MVSIGRELSCGRIVLEVAIILIAGAVLLVVNYVPTPFQRGFYCSEVDSFSYPHKPETVSTTLLIVCGISVTIFLIVVIEVGKSCSETPDTLFLDRQKKYYLGSRHVPKSFYYIYKFVGFFLFGAALMEITNEGMKNLSGKLRPSFLVNCDPVVPVSQLCRNSSVGHYIFPIECKQKDPDVLKEIRYSFPSGHAFFAFYTAVFICMYLEARVKSKKLGPLPKAVAQFIVIVSSGVVALTRISDYKHHPVDVLAGVVLGIIAAWITVVYIGNFFKRKRKTLS